MSWIHIVWILLLLSSLGIYPGGGSADAIVVFGNVAKIFSLLVCGLTLTLTQNSYKPGDAPEKAWNQLAAGMWIWFFAQIIFGYFKIVTHTSPYPSLADLFFVIAYFPLLIGLLFLIKDFKSTGLPMGSAGSYMVQGGVLLLIYAIIFKTLLWSFLTNDDSATLKFLNVGYPTFDFLLIALTSVLIRFAWILRGGSLARSWITMGIGFTILGAADITFAYHSYPFLDILYFTAYFLVALSGHYQSRMLRQ